MAHDVHHFCQLIPLTLTQVSRLADNLCVLEVERHLKVEIFLQKCTQNFAVLQIRINLLNRHNSITRQLK